MSLRDLDVKVDVAADDGGLMRLNQVINDIISEFRNLDTSIQSSTNSLNQINNQQLNHLIQEINQMRQELNQLNNRVTDLEQDLSNLNNQNLNNLNQNVSKSEGFFKKLKLGVVAVGAAVTAAFGFIGAGVAEAEDSFARLQAQTGATGEEMRALEESAKETFSRGYGESLQEVTDAMARVKQNMHEIDASELSSVTSNAMLLADVFDSDVNEVTRGANNLMQNFGIDAEKAFDLFTAGAQRGLNFSNEMFDNVAEYAPLFSQMGYSAEEYFGILERGSQAGVYNLDYVNDIMKEFQIRTKDGSKATTDAMKMMSKDTQAVWQSYLKGEGTVADVAASVVGELKNMDDQVLANQLGVSLMGTKFEDLEADAVYAMLGTTDAMKDFEGATADAAAVVEGTFKNRMLGAWRELKLGIVDVASNAGGGNILDGIASGVEKAVPIILNSLERIVEFGGAVYDTFVALIDGTDNIADIWVKVGVPPEVANGIAIFGGVIRDVFFYAKDVVMQFVNDVVIPLIPVAQSYIETAFGYIQNVVSGATTIFSALIAIIRGLIENVVVPLFPVLQSIVSTVFSVVSPILELAGSLFNFLAGVVKFLVTEIVVPLLPLIVTAVSALWHGVKPYLDFIASAFNAVIDTVQWLIDKISVVGDVLGKLDIGGKIGGFVSKVGGLIPGFEIGLGRVPYDDMPALLHKDEAVLPADEADILRKAGILKGDGTSPQLDMSAAQTYNQVSSVTSTASTASTSVHAPVQIIVQGGNTNDETAQNLRDALNEYFADLNLIMG